MADHLGYEWGQAPPLGSGNERDGSLAETVWTEIGMVCLDVPRDRAGMFASRIVSERAGRVDGFDEAIPCVRRV